MKSVAPMKPMNMSCTAVIECEACAALRETLRMCLGALATYYGQELAHKNRGELSISTLVQGGVVLRAEQALRTECTCGQEALRLSS